LKTIDELISVLYDAEGYDIDGDRSYRVHIFTAEKLIREAYELGKSENSSLMNGVDCVKLNTYRSSPMVNQNDDMVKAMITFRKKNV
jgi:hypothetical protein